MQSDRAETTDCEAFEKAALLCDASFWIVRHDGAWLVSHNDHWHDAITGERADAKAD